MLLQHCQLLVVKGIPCCCCLSPAAWRLCTLAALPCTTPQHPGGASMFLFSAPQQPMPEDLCQSSAQRVLRRPRQSSLTLPCHPLPGLGSLQCQLHVSAVHGSGTPMEVPPLLHWWRRTPSSAVVCAWTPGGERGSGLGASSTLPLGRLKNRAGTAAACPAFCGRHLEGFAPRRARSAWKEVACHGCLCAATARLKEGIWDSFCFSTPG
jgi:hypothetical protein